jgi:hypothetical protein
MLAHSLGLFFGPEDGGSTLLRNIGKLVTKYVASHPEDNRPAILINKRFYNVNIWNSNS